jgi:hypothetical protein
MRECIAKGMSVAQTGKEIGRVPASVQTKAMALGLHFARSVPLEAAETRRADARDRRHAFREALQGDLEKLRSQLFSEALVYNFGGKDNTYEEAKLDQPPIADQLRLVQAISAGISTIERLEHMDADQGVTDVVGMLDRIAAAIERAAREAAELL